MRGLWVNTCTQSPPIASIRSIAVSIPPAEDMCAPNSTRLALRIESMAASASAWPRARPASCTSAACARSSSTGCSRASRAASACLRIENTDTSREVAEAVEQIQESLRWLGIDWDGPVTFQLDRMDEVRSSPSGSSPRARRTRTRARSASGCRTRASSAGTTPSAGAIEFANENLADLVIVRSDGRPTYNFASPVEDMLDGITHVIRGNDHVSNTPTQINILARARRRAARLRARART